MCDLVSHWELWVGSRLKVGVVMSRGDGLSEITTIKSSTGVRDTVCLECCWLNWKNLYYI